MHHWLVTCLVKLCVNVIRVDHGFVLVRNRRHNIYLYDIHLHNIHLHIHIHPIPFGIYYKDKIPVWPVSPLRPWGPVAPVLPA